MKLGLALFISLGLLLGELIGFGEGATFEAIEGDKDGNALGSAGCIITGLTS